MDLINTISVWLLPLLFAITFHEAAHAYVARFLGDPTASQLGRVSLNPIRHIDPFGTVLLPGLLLFAHSPFLFGYAKPVPVNFRALRNPRMGMVLVAAAGPAMNIALAIAAALSFHLVAYLPPAVAQWTALNLKNAVVINAVLAVFNLFPLPPLDGVKCLAITGEEDRYAPPDAVRKFADQLPEGTRVEVMRDCGHLPFLEQPEAFAEIVERFLDEPPYRVISVQRTSE